MEQQHRVCTPAVEDSFGSTTTYEMLLKNLKGSMAFLEALYGAYGQLKKSKKIAIGACSLET